MKYTEKGDTITLEMSRGDYERLLVAVGIAAGVAHNEPQKKTFWAWIELANQINTGNPRFIPYEIPEEFQSHADRP